MMQQQNYITSLTSLRGIAALWVMLFHLDVIFFYRDFGPLIPHELTGIITKGYLWVDFFFLLSGFVISHVYGATFASSSDKVKLIKTFLWARFTRIYPLHLFILVLLVPLAIIVPLLFPAVVDGSWETFLAWPALLDNLLLINAMNQHVYLSWNIVSWSIGAEWWAYVCACFILPFVFKSNLTYKSIALVVSGAVLIGMFSIRGNLDITFDYGWVRCLAEFILGTIVYQVFMHQVGEVWLSKNSSFLISALMIVMAFHFGLSDILLITLFILLLLCAAYNNGLVKRALERKTLRYLGDISYSIYMMHGFWFLVFWFSLTYLKSEFKITSLSVPVKLRLGFCFVGLTIISAHYTYHYIEIKARQFLRSTKFLQWKKSTVNG
ncbi:acyltransferase family protein [Pontibacter vulgaris]|uniref:acyltransferase family protein n=1 Tax=Pontibacter vulgaris TaxID=2905679 RepID=UPI001FA78371|nr:acyltransferase [Pontibacter vulgaris]